MTKSEIVHSLATLSFNNLHRHKGLLAPLTEKANTNLATKLYKKEKGEKTSDEESHEKSKIHYFSIGHVMKNIDKTIVFGKMPEDVKPENRAGFHQLDLSGFNLVDELKTLINGIRNIHSHYVHCLKKLRPDQNVSNFIIRSFELACLMSFVREDIEKKEAKMIIKKNRLLSNDEKDHILMKFNTGNRENNDFIQKLKETFFYGIYIGEANKKKNDPNYSNPDMVDKMDFLDGLNKDELIEIILFREVENDLDWQIKNRKDGNNASHSIMKITKGKYLSFEGVLFMLTMFLYKNEATPVLQRIKGFKRSGTIEDKTKHRIFSYYAKSFNSQDVDAEMKPLVIFRDMIQYLNKYPLLWNESLKNREQTLNTEIIKSKLLENEVGRKYPLWAKEEGFIKYALEYFLHNGKVSAINELYSDALTKHSLFTQWYFNPKLKNYDRLSDDDKVVIDHLKTNYAKFSGTKINTYIDNPFKISKAKDNFNHNVTTLKLLKRINEDTFYTSNGRNNDRFIEYAIRFLADTEYFGQDAQFKMYKFPNGTEQEEYLKHKSETQKKNETYHDGRLITFRPWKQHLTLYQEWDMPFVIQNNACYIKLPTKIITNHTIEKNKTADISREICLNRTNIMYFVNHALMSYDQNNPYQGENLLTEYYTNLANDQNKLINKLSKNDKLSKEEMTLARKILPARLLKKAEGIDIKITNVESLTKILEDTKQKDARYEMLLQEAQNTGNGVEFAKKNKGKQYKLRFIKKAWHLMYFREIKISKERRAYDNKLNHHSNQHLTRDEFDDFSKWLYAFDDLEKYRVFLIELLNKKGFFEGNSLKQLVTSAKDFNEVYKKTKDLYSDWLTSGKVEPLKNSESYQIDNYRSLMAKGMVYINEAYFRYFLTSRYPELLSLEKYNKDSNHLLSYYYNDEPNSLSETKSKFLATMRERIEQLKELKENTTSEKSLKTKQETETLKKLASFQTALHEDLLLYHVAYHYLRKVVTSQYAIHENVGNVLKQVFTFNGNQTLPKEYEILVPFNRIVKYIELKQHVSGPDEGPKKSILEDIFKYVVQEDLIEKRNNVRNRTFNQKSIEERMLHLDEISKINNEIIKSALIFTKVWSFTEEYLIWKWKLGISGDIGYLKFSNIKYQNNHIEEYFPDKSIRNAAFHLHVPLGLNFVENIRTLERNLYTLEGLCSHQSENDTELLHRLRWALLETGYEKKAKYRFSKGEDRVIREKEILDSHTTAICRMIINNSFKV